MNRIYSGRIAPFEWLQQNHTCANHKLKINGVPGMKWFHSTGRYSRKFKRNHENEKNDQPVAI